MKKINWQYTFGEILIVIIGITIAFSLNRCSENAKEEKLRHQYLQSLKEDIETDEKVLATNLELLKSKKELLLKTFRYFNPQLPKRDSILMTNFFKTLPLIEFSPKNTTYQTMVNSGDYSLINNFNLKTAIQEHYGLYKQIDLDYSRMENINSKYVADYFIYNMDYSRMRTGANPFENEKVLNNIMQSMRGAIDFKISSTTKGIESCKSLLKEINTSIN